MTQRGLIHIDPSRRVSQRRDANEIGCDLRRHDMDHVELHLNLSGRGVGLGHSEPRLFRLPINRLEIVKEVQIDAVFLHIALKGGDVILDPEQNATCIHEINRDVLEHARARPMIPREIHRLLWRACAFDGHGGLRKDCAPLLHVLDEVPCVRR